jgi:hypothetical protein
MASRLLEQCLASPNRHLRTPGEQSVLAEQQGCVLSHIGSCPVQMELKYALEVLLNTLARGREVRFMRDNTWTGDW